MATPPPPPPPQADHTFPPNGTGRTLLVCAVVFAAGAALTVGLRLGLRARDRMLSWDDGLVALGLVFHLALASVSTFGTFRGVGAGPVVFEEKDREGKGYFLEMVQMVFLITMALYAVVLVTVKSAVCLLLLRIASSVQLYRRCIKVALAATFVGFVTTEIGALGECRPIEANWKDVAGATCASDYTIVVIAAVATVFSVATDWFCALFPIFMVWRMRMRRTSKTAIAAVLGLGIVASVCPLVRVRYVLEYSQMIGRFGHGRRRHGPRILGSLTLWSVLECGIGLIAASLPAIWHGSRKWRRHSQLLGADAAQNQEMVVVRMAMQNRGFKQRNKGNTYFHGLLDSVQQPTQNA